MGINNIVIQGTIAHLHRVNDNLIIGTLKYDAIGNIREHKVILEFWRGNVPLPITSFSSKKVLITGRLETSIYRTNHGVRREKTYINVTSYQILSNDVEPLRTGETTEEPVEQEAAVAEFENLPF